MRPIEIEPCPFCGAECRERSLRNRAAVQVHCTCGYHGPARRDADAAIRAHNAVARRARDFGELLEDAFGGER